MPALSSYASSKALYLNTKSTGANVSSDQTDFPICVHINTSSWTASGDRTAFFDGTNNPGGKRINFYTYADQVNPLDYEVEYYDVGSTEAVYWVRVPTVKGNYNNVDGTLNTLYVGYGTGWPGTDQDDITNVWNSGFKAVHHLVDATTSSILDSTSNNNDGAKKAAAEPATATGRVWSGQLFDGTDDYISLGTDSSLDIYTDAIAISAWINITTQGYYSVIVAKTDGAGALNNPYEFRTSDGVPCTLQMSRADASQNDLKISSSTVSASSWHHVAYCEDSSKNYAFYLDGAVSGTGTYSFTPTTQAKACLIGKRDSGLPFHGSIDEVRISSVNRASDWVKLEYASMVKDSYNGDGGGSNPFISWTEVYSSNGESTLILLKVTLLSEGSGEFYGTSALTLKKVIIVSSGGFDQTGYSDLLLLSLEVESDGITFWGTSDIELPAITIDSGGGNFIGSSALTLSHVRINSEGNMICGLSALTLKKVRLISTGGTSEYGISAFKLPIVSLSSAGGVIGTGNSALILPIVELSSSSDTGTSYLCLVLNNENSLTEWGFSFDSMVEFDGETYGANSTGLYKLGGDTDNGTEIESIIQLGLDDSGTSLLKQILGYYVGLRSDGAMNIQLIADDETDLQIHNIRTTSDTIKPRKVAVRGPRGRWIGAKIYNTNGCYFKIVSMGVLAEILQQREQNAIPL